MEPNQFVVGDIVTIKASPLHPGLGRYDDNTFKVTGADTNRVGPYVRGAMTATGGKQDAIYESDLELAEVRKSPKTSSPKSLSLDLDFNMSLVVYSRIGTIVIRSSDDDERQVTDVALSKDEAKQLVNDLMKRIVWLDDNGF